MHLFYTNKNDFSDKREIPNDYISLNWTERAYEYGQFELQVYSDSSYPIYGLGHFLTRDDTDYVMILETVSIKQLDSKIYLHKYSGRSLESLYEWRVQEHKNWIEPDSEGKFNAQQVAEIIARRNFGDAAPASRRLPNFSFHRNDKVSQMAYVNDTGNKIQDGKWIIYDRDYVSVMFKNVISACKPNGYAMFYRVKIDATGFHTYLMAPHLVETITLAEENDNFSDFESVQSIVDVKSTIYELFDTGDADLEWPADGTVHRREHTVRTAGPIDRREVLWDNTQVHKPYPYKDYKNLSTEQRRVIDSLSQVWYPFWVLDAMFPKYSPVEMVSGKIDNFSNIQFRTGFDIGDVFYYVPTGRKTPVEAQLTEMTESWSADGFSQTPTISMTSRSKWHGDSFRIDFARTRPGEVIVPRERD
jgi:hypothetical protein